jgi:hypothetical protein
MMQSVQVIIERLKTNPEDFFGEIADKKRLGGPYPKFQDIANGLDDLLTDKHDGQVHRLWYVTDAERIALLDAYKEALRARFEAKVFHTLLTKPEEDNGVALQGRSHPNTGKLLMQGANVIAPQSVFKEEGESIDAFPMWQGAVPKGEGEPV